MNTSTVLSKLIPSRRSSLRLSEVEGILDLIPQAALLVDMEQQKLVLVNSRALELTCYSRNEACGMGLPIWFPAVEGHEDLLDMDMAVLASTVTTNLRTRSGAMVVVNARLTILNAEMHWAIITFDPISELEIQQRSRMRTLELWNYVRQLSLAFQEKDLYQALTKACQSSMAIVNGQVTAVYHLDGGSPILVKTCSSGNDNWLPDRLSAEQMVRTQEIRIWNKGEALQNAIQQKARSAQMQFLGIIPLGNGNVWNGLAIVGSTQPPPDDIELTLPVIQANLSAALQIHTLLDAQSKSITQLNHSGFIAEKVFNLLHESVLLLDQQMYIQDMNQAAIQSLGYALDEVRGQPIGKILIGQTSFNQFLNRVHSEIINNPKKHKEILENETLSNRLFRRSGNSFLANVQINVLDYQGESLGFAVLIQDLSEVEDYRKRNSQLEQQALFGEMTASFVHDMKNPINNLKTGLQLLAESLPADSPFQKNLHRLKQNCDHLSTTLTSGLSFIRPNDYKMEPVQVDKLIKRLIGTNWQQRMYMHQVKCEFHVEGKPIFMEGDVQALEHLFTNLFDNAVDAMRHTPPNNPRTLGVTIRHHYAGNKPKEVEICISDTGPGIPDVLRDKIFDLFYTTKETGSGLGLAIVKSITTAHRGIASVESFVGGAIFSLKFPAMKENPNETEINRPG